MKLPFLAICGFLLCACSPQSQAPAPIVPARQSAPQNKPLPYGEVDLPAAKDPFEAVAEPDVEIKPEWLVLEAGTSDYGPTLGLAGGEKFGRHYLWNVRPKVEEYLRLKDTQSGLEGVIEPWGRSLEYGSSFNTLVFRCEGRASASAHDLFQDCRTNVSALSFVLVATFAGGDDVRVAYSQRVWKPPEVEPMPEPPPPEQPPEAPVEYPRDEPVAPENDEAEPPPPDISTLKKWQKNSIELVVVFDAKREVFGLRSTWAERKTEHQATAFRLGDVCEDGKLNRTKYVAARNRMAEAILERVEEDKEALVRWIHINTDGEPISARDKNQDRSLAWLNVVMQVDAVRVLNDSGLLGDRKLEVSIH